MSDAPTTYELLLKKHPVRMRWENFKLALSECYWRIRNLPPAEIKYVDCCKRCCGYRAGEPCDCPCKRCFL
jgi:hypothetical protein